VLAGVPKSCSLLMDMVITSYGYQAALALVLVAIVIDYAQLAMLD